MRTSSIIAVPFLFALFLQVNVIHASSVIVPAPSKSNTTAAANVNYFKASEFVKLSAKDFAKLTGKRLNVFQRMSFQILKRKMKHDLKKNPNLLITDYTKNPSHAKSRISFLWFILGIAGVIIGLLMPAWPLFLLFAIAPVAMAYITKQDKENIKSVWIGFGVGVVLLLLLIAIIVASLGGYTY